MSAPSLEKDDITETRKVMYLVCEKAGVMPTPELLKVVLLALHAGQVLGMGKNYNDAYYDGAAAMYRRIKFPPKLGNKPKE
jgi:hypothetical protein